MREGLKKLSNFVDADVLLEEEPARPPVPTLSDVHVEGAEATVDTHNTRCQDASTYGGAPEDARGEAEGGSKVNLGDEEGPDFCGVSEDVEAEDQAPVGRFDMLS